MDLTRKFKETLLEPPHAILGKKGIEENQGFIEHVLQLLKTHKIIKIKFLKTALHGILLEDIITKITKETDSYLLDKRGRTIIISKIPLEP